jgi:arylsulfate sulfotransferase
MLSGKMVCLCASLSILCVLLAGCGDPPSVQISPSAVLLSPGQSFQFTISRIGSSAASGQPTPVLLVNGVVGGSGASGTITLGGVYTAPASITGQPITISVQGQQSSAVVSLFNPASLTPGAVASTQNPLVASYSLIVPAGSSVEVQFGTDTSYGFSTSGVQTADGGSLTVLVAGMRANTVYHMQAIVTLANNSQLLDIDHTFTTGPLPSGRIPNITTQTTGVGAPSPGVELLSMVNEYGGNNLSGVAADLAGSVIWYYDLGATAWPTPIKPLPNGHMLVLADPAVPGAINEVREVDLAGNIITRLTLAQVNQALLKIDFPQLAALHHDVLALPNGHWILLGNYSLAINNVEGIPPNTGMTGDALIDWDPKLGPVWTWSAFNFLPLTHAPYGFTDWTHSNAVIYSPDDGNLIVSMRNQNWIIKINYQNGAGDGSVLWRFGDGGDFTLPPGEAPIEWNYGQHYPTIVSQNSSGVFSLMFFNDGNNRLMNSDNTVCGTSGVGACYSSVPIFQLDEFNKAATVLWEDDLLPYYSLCCGDALMLPNGDAEVDIAFDQTVTPGTSDIQEVTRTQSPQLVWEMQVQGQLAYRGLRIPSLYPGQVWPAATQQPSKSDRATSIE